MGFYINQTKHYSSQKEMNLLIRAIQYKISTTRNEREKKDKKRGGKRKNTKKIKDEREEKKDERKREDEGREKIERGNVLCLIFL